MLPVKLKQKHFCEFRLARAESTGSGKRSTDAGRDDAPNITIMSHYLNYANKHNKLSNNDIGSISLKASLLP